jgi:hypothetical protein
MTVYTEFQPLKKILIGSTYRPDVFEYHSDKEFVDMMSTIFEETQEDLDKLAKICSDYGAEVVRPKVVLEPKDEINIGINKGTFANHPMQPRDVIGKFGNTIIEGYSKEITRYFENWSYRDVIKEEFRNGSRVISMPTPEISADDGYDTLDDRDEFVFHTANVVKCGKHLFHTQSARDARGKSVKHPVSGRGTQAGLLWMERELLEFEFEEVPAGGHLDGKIAIIRPGLVVAWNEDHVPQMMKDDKWDIIIAGDRKKFYRGVGIFSDLFLNKKHNYNLGFPKYFEDIRNSMPYKLYVQDYLSHWIGYVEETVFHVNTISLDENTVIMTGYNKDVYKKLEKQGIDVINWDAKHRFFWDGGAHCCSIDLDREGGQENYF